jgi:hypothetical protein
MEIETSKYLCGHGFISEYDRTNEKKRVYPISEQQEVLFCHDGFSQIDRTIDMS